MKKIFTLLLLLAPAIVSARPILTEPVEPVGKYTFETGAALQYREDEFGPGSNELERVYIPFYIKFGIFQPVEFLFKLDHATQRLDTANARYTGSSDGRVSLGLKISPLEYAGLQVLWHAPSPEKDDQEIAFGRGNDTEVNLLLSKPDWFLHLNAGYVIRESYVTNFSVQKGQEVLNDPGDFFQARASWEFPLMWNFYLLNEWTYYDIGKQTLGGVEVAGTDGTAYDTLVGVTWQWGGWNIGTGAAFGLGDEGHTSFDLNRGAGDVDFVFSLAYRFKPKPPERWDQ